ncbi:MAG: hypothetical protein E3J21_16880 [Anaerolineales bacterium]|nr:MAG: hypothetical protein E3J21_16880 [Anaerolineales bacterium]
MKGRHAFKISFAFSVNFCLDVDFERCVAVVSKRFLTVLTAIRSGIASFLSKLFAIPSLRWTVDTLKKLAVIVVLVLVSHRLITAIDGYFGLGWPSETRQSLADLFSLLLLQKVGFIK